MNSEFKLKDIVVIGALVVNIAGVGWFGAQLVDRVSEGEKARTDITAAIKLLVEAKDKQIETTSQLAARVGAAERQQISMDNSINNLNAKTAEADIHFTKLDDKLGSIADNVASLLDIAAQLQDRLGGGEANQSSNFPHPR